MSELLCEASETLENTEPHTERFHTGKGNLLRWDRKEEQLDPSDVVVPFYEQEELI